MPEPCPRRPGVDPFASPAPDRRRSPRCP